MMTLASLRSVTTPRSGFTLLATVLLIGCASPGTPRPPSLHLPKTVSNLTAERVGDKVLLRWTTPAKTTDGLNVETPLTAQLCRRLANSPTVKQESCTPVRRLSTQPGPAEAVDTLSPALAQGTASVLEYRVEILNGRERSAGLSAPALAATGTAPPLVDGLRAEATASGAFLQWTPEDAADQVELSRLHSLPTTASKPVQKQPAPLLPSEKEPTEVHLLANKASAMPFQPDTGGTVDQTAHRGETYSYTAQRVRHLQIAGQSFELRSGVSPPVTLVVRDTFPPHPPIRVEAIASPSGIDLSWMPNTEADLAGYLVYRTVVTPASAGVSGQRITPVPVLEPAFRDTAVALGHSYLYTVVAVDKAGNQSAPSEPAREEVPLP